MDGTKKLLIALGAVAVVLLVVVANLIAQLGGQEKIHQAEVEAAQVRAQRDSITAVVAARDSMRQVVEVQAVQLTGEANDLRVQVAAAEQARATAQLGVRRLRTSEATEQRFRETFPEFSEAMRVTEVAPPEDPAFSIKYIMVPSNFAQTFIIDHQNSASFEAQRDSLRVLDSLNLEIIALKDSITHLVELNADAYRVGYDSAFTKFEQRTAEYISLLREPRFRLDVPSLSVILGSAAIGVAIGTRF